MKLHLFIWFTLVLSVPAFSQFKEVNALIAQRKLNAVDSLLSSNQLSETDKSLIKGKLFVERNMIDSAFSSLLTVDTLSLSLYQKATFYDYLASVYDQNIEYDLVVSHIDKAKSLYEELGLETEANEMNMQLYLTLLASPFYKGDDVKYLNTFYENAKKLNNYSQLSRAEINLAFENFNVDDPMQFTDYFDRAVNFAEKSGNPLDLARIYTYYGMMYGENFLRPEIAEKYYDDALDIYRAIEDGFKQKPIYILKANLARQKNNYLESINLLKEADLLGSSPYETELNIRIYKQLADDFKAIGETDSAFAYMELYDTTRDLYSVQQQNINIARFEAEKKDKENVLLQKKNQQAQFIIYFTSLFAFLVVVASYLIYKNNKKKQLLKEKEIEIIKTKFETDQKRLELSAIDNLITAQEQERKRIAEDLHDNVGALLTSVNMHFDVLVNEVSENDKFGGLVEKTQHLLKDAYSQIRNMAHFKNAGQLANRGIIPAVRNLAKTSSSVKGVQFNLNLSELDIRINNDIEIGIFRSIQELVTNAIKHAKASSISISVFEENNLLNITVEDDGIGFKFNRSEFEKQNGHNKHELGMGLPSLFSRVESYGGKLDIESTPGEGTIIIIQIPI
jgi:signal transduction histidine kinase